MQIVEHTEHSRLIFLDESGAKTNMTRLYGRAQRGERVRDSVPSGRWETTTMIAAVGRNGPQAPWVFDGALDADIFGFSFPRSAWECIRDIETKRRPSRILACASTNPFSPRLARAPAR